MNDSPDPSNATPADQPPEPVNNQPFPPDHPATANAYLVPKPHWYKRKSFWVILLVVFVILSGAGTAYYLSLNQPKPQPAAQPSTAAKVAVYDLHALLYSSSVEKVADHCLESTTTIHQLPLDSPKATDIVTLDDYQGITDYATYHEDVVLATMPTCASNDGPSLWLSHDSGKTYKQVYTAKNKVEQITSVAFSSDGSEVAFGSLAEAGKPNTVKTMNVKSSEVKELFTTDQSGILIKSYDSKNQRVYYQQSCYNCDVLSYGDLMVYETGKSRVAFEHPAATAGDFVVNAESTRAVHVSFTPSTTQPSQITVKEYDLSTQKTVNTETYTDTATPGTIRVGYTTEGLAYYTTGKKIMTVSKSGATSILAELPDTMAQIYYASKTRVVYRVATMDGGHVVNYDVKADKASQLLDYKHPTAPLGMSLAEVDS